MKTAISKVIGSSALIVLSFSTLIFGQGSVGSDTPAVLKAQDAVNKVLDDSGKYFKDGLSAFQSNKRLESGQNFDKSVEVFLYSTINIQKDQRLQSCYSQLIETVYRIEFPSDAQMPQIRGLSAVCGWKWNDSDLKMADAVALMSKPTGKSANDVGVLATVAGGSAITNKESLTGFNSQEFEPSPLDELSKL